MTIQVLISCMNQTDFSIITKSNVQTDVLVVNQCDNNCIEEFDFLNKKGNSCHAKFISTTERGLSRSRNMAITNAWCDICFMCDDDEILDSDYFTSIISAFERNPDYDILAFNLTNPRSVFPNSEKEITYWRTGKLSSCQIAFRRNDVILSTPFNTKMGSGTGNGGGEENKFLLDCMSKGLKIKYVPIHIGEVAQSISSWFFGYDKSYWISRGWIAKVLYGKFNAVIYIFGQVLLRVWQVDKEHNPLQIFFWMLRGWNQNR